jgi:hypothetical protein
MSITVLVGLAASLVVSIYYFYGWTPPWLWGAMSWHGSDAGEVGTRTKKEGKDDTHYLGTIIMSPRRGDKCWERGLDNRNGAMWEKGPIDCDVVPSLRTLEEEAKGLAARRLKAIGKAFAPKSN